MVLSPQETQSCELVELLRVGEPRLVLISYGFLLYPIELRAGVESCPAVAVPGCKLPHRAFLAFLEECVESVEKKDESFHYKYEDGYLFIEVDGLSAAFEGAGDDAAKVCRKEDPPNGHTPRCHPEVLDMGRVPDFETMCSGISLSEDWPDSDFIRFRIGLHGGILGSIAQKTTEKVWRWSLDDFDARRRVSALTGHRSDPLPSLVVEFRRRRNTDHGVDYVLVGRVVTKPLPGGCIVAGLVNMPFDEKSNKFFKPEEHAINVAHLHAMLMLCEPDGLAQVKTVFGQLLTSSGNVPSPSLLERADLTPFVRLFQFVQGFSQFYDGNPSCGARRMPVREG